MDYEIQKLVDDTWETMEMLNDVRSDEQAENYFEQYYSEVSGIFQLIKIISITENP